MALDDFVFNRYQWFCHSDDDVYVNVLELSRFLKQYNPHKPYYVGKFPQFYYKLPYIPVSATDSVA